MPAGASSELHDLTGVWAAVKYLVTVGGSQTGLVERHARWILTVDPEAGLEMLTDMQPPLEPETVLTILADQAPALCATFLEAALQRGSVTAQASMPRYNPVCGYWSYDQTFPPCYCPAILADLRRAACAAGYGAVKRNQREQ